MSKQSDAEPVDNQRRARLRGLVEMHSHEVDEVVGRLRQAHAGDRLETALSALLDRGSRYQFASGFERALLAELGVRARVEHNADGEHGRILDAQARRDRRARGLACPTCFDSGWRMVDMTTTTDDGREVGETTAHRCDCVR